MLKLYKKYYPLLETLLQKYNLEITDTHAHPLEVMNVLDLDCFSQVNKELFRLKTRDTPYETFKESFTHGGFMTNLNHNLIDTALSEFAFHRLPKEVEKSIKESYAFIGPQRLGDELKASGIGRMVLLAVAPYNSIDEIHGIFGEDERWDYLGSIDIHGTKEEDIEGEILRQKGEYGIVGLKLHPNLQGFYPFPDDNPGYIAGRLDVLYKTAEKAGLYILLHGGWSNIPARERQLQKYPAMLDKSGGHYGLPENLFDEKGKSRLLDKYRSLFVIAHCAQYGIKNPSVKSLVRFYHNYPDLRLETSSVSAGLISEVVRNTDSKRIIFGSDALYNKQLNELLICLKGIKKGSGQDRFEENCLKILGGNYSRLRESLNR